ncbi:Spy/CpxP family protein refolding chaperone [Rhodopseudomonas sp.]|uniref:Spy/CpxP family protein refolding chaperone n=1 Tax=Rhodopseudomonas sp. TaxID=1078 RepID=UPI003B3A79C9
MKKVLLAGATVLALAGSSAAYAQHHGWFDHHRDHSPKASAEDRAAFADARIAAVHAGLKLTPDQEKLWPPLEAAVKDFAKLRIDRAEARIKARDDDRDSQAVDPVSRLRDRADSMAATAAAMKKIADAADPLYKSLDDGQKRRLRVLTRMEGGWGRGPHHHRWMHRNDDDRGPRWNRDRGPGGPGGPGMMEDHDDEGGPHRL